MPPKPKDDLKNRKKSEPKEPESEKGKKKEKTPKEETPKGETPKEDSLKEIPKEGSPKGMTGLDLFKLRLLNRGIQVAAALIALALILIALFCAHLYLAERKKLSEKYRAVTRIRQFMVNYNDSFQDHDEIEAMKGVKVLLDQVHRQQARSAEVQKSTDFVLNMMKNNWIPFKGHLYYFDDRIDNFDFASKSCRGHNSWVAYIKSNEEEDFLEATINKRARAADDSYWIGLTKRIVWDWINKERLTHRYWAPRYPRLSSAYETVCTYIPKCTEKRKCWKDAYCTEKRKWVCKWKGDARWL